DRLCRRPGLALGRGGPVSPRRALLPEPGVEFQRPPPLPRVAYAVRLARRARSGGGRRRLAEGVAALALGGGRGRVPALAEAAVRPPPRPAVRRARVAGGSRPGGGRSPAGPEGLPRGGRPAARRARRRRGAAGASHRPPR